MSNNLFVYFVTYFFVKNESLVCKILMLEPCRNRLSLKITYFFCKTEQKACNFYEKRAFFMTGDGSLARSLHNLGSDGAIGYWLLALGY